MGNTKTADTIGTSVLELAKFNEARQNSFEEIMLIEISMTTKIKPEMEISIFKERFFPNTTVDLKNKDLNKFLNILNHKKNQIL
jgi:hypothetical protein